MKLFYYLLFLLLLWVSVLGQTTFGNCWSNRGANARNKKDKIRGVNLNGLHSIDSDFIALLYQDENTTNTTNTYLNTTYGLTDLYTNATLPSLTLVQWIATAQAVGLDTPTLLNTARQRHYNEVNFALMGRAGLNSVRLNVPWWTIYDGAVAGTLGGDLALLDKAFDWAYQYGISVLLNLYYMAGQIEAPTTMWNESNVNASLAALTAYVTRYAAKPALLGFQVTNEAVYGGSTQSQYYLNAYAVVRAACAACVVVISGTNNALLSTFMIRTYTNVWTEFHFRVSTNPPDTDTVWNDTYAFKTTIDAYAISNNLITKGRPLLIGDWSGEGIVGPPLGSTVYPNMLKQFFTLQRTLFAASKNAGWYYTTWTQSPLIDALKSPSYLSALQAGYLTVNDVAEDTNPCPPKYTCVPKYTNTNPNTLVNSNVAYVNATGACGLCGTTQLMTKNKVKPAKLATHYQLVGCFADNATNPDLLVSQSVPVLSLNSCNVLCAGFNFFAVQSTATDAICSCGDFYGTYGVSTNCTAPCPGSSGQICGHWSQQRLPTQNC